MDTRHPASEDGSGDADEGIRAAPGGTPGRRAAVLALVLALGGILAGAAAPPTPPPLGASEAALRERYGEALRPVDVARARSVFEQIAPAPPGPPEEPSPPPGPAQQRLARTAPEGEVRRVEYDLAEDRVYRVRWQLAERFEHPILDDVVERLSEGLGRPDYDQTLRAELGSPRSDLRRTGWTLGPHALEIRQLHPFTGGPIFVSLADREALQAIVDAKGVPLPQPETTGAWWRRPQRAPRLLEEARRRELADAVAALVARLARSPDEPTSGDGAP